MEMDEVDESNYRLAVRAEGVGPLSIPHGGSAAPVVRAWGASSASAAATGRGLWGRDLVGYFVVDAMLNKLG
jgi:hypothetical protein